MNDARVRSKLEATLAVDPLGRADDPWAEFRQIERLTLELTQIYRHSLGKTSRFFLELERGRFFATRCASCSQTYAPPRPLCPNCLIPTTWVELAGTGTVGTFSVLHFGPGTNDDVRALMTPYVLAYILLDGASTLFPHLLDSPPDRVHIGMRVRVAYKEVSVFHPIHLMHFVED
jgi:uncharacterized OB-fold protein